VFLYCFIELDKLFIFCCFVSSWWSVCLCSSIVFGLLQTFDWLSLLTPYYAAWWKGVVRALKKGELMCLWWGGFCVHWYYESIVKNDIGIEQFAFVCFKIKKYFLCDCMLFLTCECIGKFIFWHVLIVED